MSVIESRLPFDPPDLAAKSSDTNSRKDPPQISHGKIVWAAVYEEWPDDDELDMRALMKSCWGHAHATSRYDEESQNVFMSMHACMHSPACRAEMRLWTM